MFRNTIRFCGQELLAPRPTSKLEDHPLSAVRDCLFTIFAATFHTGGRSSIRNLRTRHAVVTPSTCTVTSLFVLFRRFSGHGSGCHRGDPASIPGQSVWQNRTRTGFVIPSSSVFPCQYHSTNAPHCSSEQCSCQTDKPAKPGKPQIKQCFFCRKHFTFCHTRYLSRPFSSHAIKYKCNLAYSQYCTLYSI